MDRGDSDMKSVFRIIGGHALAFDDLLGKRSRFIIDIEHRKRLNG